MAAFLQSMFRSLCISLFCVPSIGFISYCMHIVQYLGRAHVYNLTPTFPPVAPDINLCMSYFFVLHTIPIVLYTTPNEFDMDTFDRSENSLNLS